MGTEHISSSTIGTTYTVTIPEKLRNKGWAESFGNIQEELRNLSENFDEIKVNFTKCNWADPLPLLSLLIALSEIPNNISKTIHLPTPNVYSFEQKRFLAFVFKEGFVENCSQFNIRVLHSTSNEFSEKEKEQIINNYEKYLSYTDCTILPAKIVNLLDMVGDEKNYIAKIESEVEIWLEKTKHRFSSNVASVLEKELLNKIDRFLKETIGNVYEHAYPDNKYDKKLVGCYIRYRKGLANGSLDENSRKNLQNYIEEEHRKCPRLRNYYPNSRTTFSEQSSGFFEVFIIDAGIGLTNNFYGGATPHPLFREVWRLTIGLGKRGINSGKKDTEFGGLYTISQLCRGDCLTARDDSEWLGDMLPVKGTNPETDANQSYLSITSPRQIEGFALIGRIEALTLKAKNEKWLNLYEVYTGEKNESPFIKAIQEPKDIYTKYFKKVKEFYVRDERFGNAKMLDESESELCLFFPSERLPKNQIFKIINNELLQKINNIKQRAIIIADIPVGEANIYQYALCKASYTTEFISKIDKIILITRNLTVSALSKRKINGQKANEQYDTYDYDRGLTESFLLSTFDTAFSPHLSLKHCVELIRTHDSLLYWRYIDNKNRSYEFFLSKDIVWYQDGRDIGLKGYLNFAKTLTDEFCKKIYELALERSLCLSNEAGCNYESIDLLTNKLAMQNNVLFHNAQKDNAQKILLGSVYVTGYTARASQAGNKENEDNAITIHFFHNQNVSVAEMPTNPIAQFLLWPREEWITKNLKSGNLKLSQCKRIGTSYVIAPYGWKYFPIPRYKLFDKENKCFLDIPPTKEQIQNTVQYEFKSVYECSPSDTYRYWQGRRGQVLNIGHIDYESSHDILNIDFPFVINESFMMGDKLSQFLLAEFLYALGTDARGLNTDNPVIANGVKQYLKNKTTNNKTTKNKSILIVYPFHYNSDYIVAKIKTYIKQEYHNKIIALFPVNRERANATYLISPLTIETLKDEINKNRKKDESIEVLLFDDAIIGGKTRKEIKHTLISLGVDSVKTLTLLERRRLPFSPSEPNNNRAFWRLDMPNLGGADTCPICNALQKLKEIRHNIASESILDRIQEIEKIWEANNNKQLLTPIAIKDGILEKKFGIYINDEGEKYSSLQCGGDNNKIEIINSLGLSIYVSELHTMTSRDDIVLDFLKDTEQGEPIIEDYVKIEMLATYLLLFKKELSNLTLEKIIKELFRLCKDKETNNYTSYVLIALLNVNAKRLNLLYNVCKKEVDTDIEVKNQDMIILSFLLSLDNQSDFSKSKSLKKYRTKDLKDIYGLFHSEIYNDNGISHSVPLFLISTKDANKNNFQMAADSCKKILHLLEDGIPFWLYRSDIKTQKDQIVKLLKNYETQSKAHPNDFITLSPLAENLLCELQYIHSLLFGCVGAKEEEKIPLKELIQELITDKKFSNIGISSAFKKLILSNTQIERWIIWDSYVYQEISFLFDNAIKEGSETNDPFSENNDIIKNAWVSIEYDEKNKQLFLLIYNKSNNTSEQVKEETNKKMRYGKNHLTDIGIKVDYQSVIIENMNEKPANDYTQQGTNRFLKTIIIFPYI
ncbi:MAG: hypothetical protein FWG84_03205 [Bacteroidales bacterium]|nr:hypothetical protein [Bacteroidales bacterium]